jgi:hypothetical protein
MFKSDNRFRKCAKSFDPPQNSKLKSIQELHSKGSDSRLPIRHKIRIRNISSIKSFVEKPTGGFLSTPIKASLWTERTNVILQKVGLLCRRLGTSLRIFVAKK